MRKIIKLGVTGGIASGKKLGAQTINSDELGHQAYLPGSPSYHAIIQEFGKEVVEKGTDGNANQLNKINRVELGKKVFADRSALSRLEAIVWPAVFTLAQDQMKQMEQKIQQDRTLPPVIVLEAALLVEAGWKQHFDCLWVFSVPPPVAQQRVVLRNNVSLDEAARRLASQSPNALREAQADHVFETDRDSDLVKNEVVREWHALLALSKL